MYIPTYIHMFLSVQYDVTASMGPKHFTYLQDSAYPQHRIGKKKKILKLNQLSEPLGYVCTLYVVYVRSIYVGERYVITELTGREGALISPRPTPSQGITRAVAQIRIQEAPFSSLLSIFRSQTTLARSVGRSVGSARPSMQEGSFGRDTFLPRCCRDTGLKALG